MSLINYAIYGSYKEIPREEYYEWFKNASIIREESCVISNFCGPHEFSTTISKNGMIYELGWGWHVENGKTIEWYGMRKLHINHNQNAHLTTNKYMNNQIILKSDDITPIVNQILIDAKNNQNRERCTYLGINHLKEAIDNYISNHPNTPINNKNY